MPGGTNEGRDVNVNFSIPIIITGDGKECRAPGPWGAPGEISEAKQILEATAALLALLQKAQLEGHLAEPGLCELESLQRFYTALKLQVDQAK